MAGKATTSFLLISSLLLLAFSATICESRNLHRINHRSIFDPLTLCEHSAHYAKICEDVVHAAHHVTSPATLVEANLAAAIEKARMALTEVSGLMTAKSQDYRGMKASALRSCKENYDSTVDALQQSQNLLKTSGSHDDLITQLSAASTFVSSCQDSLDEVAEMKYPFQSLHIILDHHVSNCLNLGSQLLH